MAGHKKSNRKRTTSRKIKKKFDVKRIALPLIAIIAIIAIASAFYFIPKEQVNVPGGGNNTNPLHNQLLDCDDLEIDVDSITEALGYYRLGSLKPALTGDKFEILSMTVTNNANSAKDFSGYRLELVSDSNHNIPVMFNGIEKVVLMNNMTVDYTCSELALASTSRLSLNTGESASGCKIFQILENLTPETLLVYNMTGLKCSVAI